MTGLIPTRRPTVATTTGEDTFLLWCSSGFYLWFLIAPIHLLFLKHWGQIHGIRGQRKQRSQGHRVTGRPMTSGVSWRRVRGISAGVTISIKGQAGYLQVISVGLRVSSSEWWGRSRRKSGWSRRWWGEAREGKGGRKRGGMERRERKNRKQKKTLMPQKRKLKNKQMTNRVWGWRSGGLWLAETMCEKVGWVGERM